MSNPRLAGRYAKSLVDLAIEKNQLEAVYADMKYLQAVAKVSREFRNLLTSPVIKSDQKRSIIDALTKGKIGELSALFINLLVTKGREGELVEIASAFVDQYNEMKGIHRIKLTTAVSVSDEMKRSIENKIKSERGLANVELETAVDEKLIGGFVLEFNNNLVDASILRDLKDIKKQFSQNLFIQSLR
jgi:F-type H+-transporting ATPase subunit delta